jgi:CMP-N-acetylneuraminic acid synthetase
MEEKDLYGAKSFACVMSKEHSVDIDDAFDFLVAEATMTSACQKL